MAEENFGILYALVPRPKPVKANRLIETEDDHKAGKPITIKSTELISFTLCTSSEDLDDLAAEIGLDFGSYTVVSSTTELPVYCTPTWIKQLQRKVSKLGINSTGVVNFLHLDVDVEKECLVPPGSYSCKIKAVVTE